MNYKKIKEAKNIVKNSFNDVIESHNLNDNNDDVKKSFFKKMYDLISKNYALINKDNIKTFNGLNYQMFDVNDIFDYKKSNYPFNVMVSNGIEKAITYTLNENLKTKLFFVFSNSNSITTINEIVVNEILNLLIIKEILFNDIKSFIKYHYYSDNGITAVYVDFSSFFDKMTNYFIYGDLIVGYDEHINMCDLKLQSIILWEKKTLSYKSSFIVTHGYILQFLKRTLEKYNKYKMNYMEESSSMALYRDMPCENEVIIKFKTNMIICL